MEPTLTQSNGAPAGVGGITPPPPARILIADEDATALHATAWLLKTEGYSVTTAHGGGRLLEQLEEESPDLILLDAAVAGTEHDQTLGRIKADDRWREVPVLVLAPLAPADAAPIPLRPGVDFLRKPVRVPELLARIDTQVRTHHTLAWTRAALRTTEDALQRARDDNARLEVLAHTDPLTQALNRRALTQRLAAELDRARRYDAVVTLLMIDLDYFKAVNDQYGHAAGDTALRRIADLLHHAVRSVDVVARYGGEEFVIVLPETTETGAVAFAERIRERIEQEWLPMSVVADVAGLADGFRITASVGVATFPAPLVDSADDFFARADAALYRAKAEGRNCVRT